MDINLNYRDEFIELVTPIIENEKVKLMTNIYSTEQQVLWIIASQ